MNVPLRLSRTDWKLWCLLFACVLWSNFSCMFLFFLCASSLHLSKVKCCEISNNQLSFIIYRVQPLNYNIINQAGAEWINVVIRPLFPLTFALYRAPECNRIVNNNCREMKIQQWIQQPPTYDCNGINQWLRAHEIGLHKKSRSYGHLFCNDESASVTISISLNDLNEPLEWMNVFVWWSIPQKYKTTFGNANLA